MNVSIHAVERVTDANRIFGASAIRELALGDPPSALAAIWEDYSRSYSDDSPASVRSVLEWAQRILAKKYQTEYYYKSILLKKLVLGVHSPKTLAVFSEFKIGRCRADLVLVNGLGTVYEVKTGLDDLNRASRQVKEYYKCFSQVVFVVDARHVGKAIEILPQSVGISCITNRQQLKVLRPYKKEISFLSSKAMFSCLRRREYEEILGELSPSIDLANYREVLNCVDRIDAGAMQDAFTKILRRRGLSSPRLGDIPQLPPSLLPAAYLYKMSRREWAGLINVLDRDMADVLERSF